jgi:hypothetical protein
VPDNGERVSAGTDGVDESRNAKIEIEGKECGRVGAGDESCASKPKSRPVDDVKVHNMMVLAQGVEP